MNKWIKDISKRYFWYNQMIVFYTVMFLAFYILFKSPILTITKFNEYTNVGYFFFISLILSLILFSLAFFLSLTNIKDNEKLSEYECGFEPFDNATRHPFDVHFYIVGILFLIFDVEIAILFPWVLGIKTMGWVGINSMFFVLVILTIGFVYEWRRGALIWPHNKN